VDVVTVGLIAGALFLLISIAGGGFTIRELQVPVVPTWARLASAFVGVLFVFLPIIYEQFGDEPSPPNAATNTFPPALIPQPTETFTPFPTATATPSPTATQEPTATPTEVPTATFTPVPTNTPTLMPPPPPDVMPPPPPDVMPPPPPDVMPPPPLPPVVNPVPDGYIPLLNGYVTTLQFYESGYNGLPLDQRVYDQRFARETTRYIWNELTLEYPAPGRRVDFKLTVIYYRDTGAGSWEELHRYPVDTYVEGDWTWSYYDSGYGFNDPGTWQVGLYLVEIYFEGLGSDSQLIASKQFEIY
jgi:hypothetical protein